MERRDRFPETGRFERPVGPGQRRLRGVIVRATSRRRNTRIGEPGPHGALIDKALATGKKAKSRPK